jgi:sulfate adenylyltransferase subunit 1 (EFTu-like GTPase family)
MCSVARTDEEAKETFPPMSVTVRLDDDLDVSRGAVIRWLHCDLNGPTLRLNEED